TAGFMAAFWSNFAVWQRQTVALTRARAADDMVNQLMSILHTTNQLVAYLSSLHTVSLALRDDSGNLAASETLRYLAVKAPEFAALREQLRGAHLWLTEVPVRYSNVMTNI